MNIIRLLIFCVIMSNRSHVRGLNEFATCHEDFNLKPPDGVVPKNTFGWLGFAQYSHVTTGLPHHSKSPRVILVQKQFVIGTVTDLLLLPKNYKLGSVIFGEYERDEEECGLTKIQLKKGEKCTNAYLETPVLEVTPHPEYSRFGVGNSLVLVKLLRPIKSFYMLPICMPSIGERIKKKKNKSVFMVDYLSTLPRDLNSERMGKKTLKLYTHKDCRKHRSQWELGSEGVTHVLCTSGCGVRPGAPIVSQNADGAFELIGVAAGSAPCARQAMRQRLIKEPPIYIDVYPYTTWIMNVVTAHELPLPYPSNFRRTDNGARIAIHNNYLRQKKAKEGWRGRIYAVGNFCFRSQKTQTAKGAFFYSEKFEVNAKPPGMLNITMTVSAGIECTIVCARLVLPNRMMTPTVTGLNTFAITVVFNTEFFPFVFFYTLGLTGRNSSQKNMIKWLPHLPPGQIGILKFIKCINIQVSVQRQVGALLDFSTCHDDFGLKPPDGVLQKNTFGWLGFIQYMHIITGLPHHRKAPRVMLIQKQFVIGTAVDLLQLPVNYKMGNVIFGEYEREEGDCGLTLAQIKMGIRCPHAYLEIPLLAITSHPEYSRFGVGNSLALAKLLQPLKSGYMMPICMPSISERLRKRKNKFVFMVDYISTVPTDFDVERMGKKTLELLTHEECRIHRLRAMLGSEGVTHMLCSSGCGVRSGAPIVSQNMEGAFELIGIAAGGALCGQSSHREHLIKKPPLYIDVYPYTRWLVSVISAYELPLPYPSNFRKFDGVSSMGIRADYLRQKLQKSGWSGRTYLTGNFCHRNKKRQWKSGFFYSEVFQVNLKPNTKLTVNMTISAGIQCTIICARLLLPNRLILPQIKGVGGSNISIYIQTELFPSVSSYTLGLLGKNTTQKNLNLLKKHINLGWWRN